MSVVGRYSDQRPFVVLDNSAFGDININFRFIESVKQINRNKFEIISYNYADQKYGGRDGGNNFPANTFKYTVELNNFDNWEITHQALLEQSK